jgi:hypothetical protein
MVAYKYYELPYELQDRLSLISNNSYSRNLEILGSINQDKSGSVEVVKFNPTGDDYTSSNYIVPSLPAVKQNLVDIIGSRYRNINNRIMNPVKDVSGFIISEVSSRAELIYPFADPTLYNKNSMIIIRLMSDITILEPLRVPIGASVIIDLNSFTLTIEANYLFEIHKNLGVISIFNGKLKLGSSVSSYFYIVQEYMLGVYTEFGLTSMLSGFYPYDILSISSSSDKKLTIDTSDLALKFYFYRYSRQIKFMTSDNKIEFINDSLLTGKSIATNVVTGTGIFVLNSGSLSLVADALKNSLTGYPIPSNLLFTI